MFSCFFIYFYVEDRRSARKLGLLKLATRSMNQYLIKCLNQPISFIEFLCLFVGSVLPFVCLFVLLLDSFFSLFCLFVNGSFVCFYLFVRLFVCCCFFGIFYSIFVFLSVYFYLLDKRSYCMYILFVRPLAEKKN